MARPKKEGLDYFPHDTDAVNDEKIEGLRILYGNDGYAFYFILLERIYRTKELFLDVFDAETRQIFIRKIAVDEQKFDRMLNTALKLGCFDAESYKTRGVLTSNGIVKRASVVLEKREKARQKRETDQSATDDDSGVSDTETPQQTRQQTEGQTGESKVKESKVKEKESKAKESKEKEEEKHYEENIQRPSVASSGKPDLAVVDNCPHQKIIDLYHEALPALPRVQVWGEGNQTTLRARWREAKERQTLAWWAAYFKAVRESDFLSGRRTEFRATLSWLVKAANMEKVLNGQYDNHDANFNPKLTRMQKNIRDLESGEWKFGDGLRELFGVGQDDDKTIEITKTGEHQ